MKDEGFHLTHASSFNLPPSFTLLPNRVDHLLLVGLAEFGMHRQRQDFTSRALGFRQRVGTGQSSLVGRLKMDRPGIVNPGSDFAPAQKTQQLVTARRSDDVQVKDVWAVDLSSW